MQFLNPGFLVALAAAGIPILLHFLSRRKVIDVPFAPLRFLQPTQERQMRRLNLRRLLLLLIRVGIIVCLVLAFARPTLTGGLASLARGGEHVSALLLVDDSASMQTQVSGGTLFGRACDEAAAIAGELERGDEILVALFSDAVRPLFTEFLRDPAIAINELREARPGTRRTDYLAALQGGFELLERASHEHREVYVIGDLQQVEIDSTRLARFHQRLRELPTTNVYLRAVEQEPFVNRQLMEVERPATLLRSGQSAEIAVRVRQDGRDPLPAQLFLQVEGVTISETELQLPGAGQQRHVFPLTLPQKGDLAASVRLRPDRYPLDDELYFVLAVGDQLPLLVLRGVGSDEGERDPLLFLLAALDPEGRGAGRFALEVDTAGRFDVEALGRAHVVVGTDLRDLGAARLAALREYVHSGGTLLLFVGDPRVLAYTNETLLPELGGLRLGAFRGEEETYERLEIVATDHPVFTGFDLEALATFEEVRLRNFFRLDESVGRSLVRFVGGGSAISELEVGRGRLIVCGFHTSAAAGDLPWSPMFLPLVQRLTGYLATEGWGRFGRHFEVGSPLVVEAPELGSPAQNWSVELPSGEVVAAALDASTTPARVVAPAAERPGIVRFRQEGEPFALGAVNVAGSESDRRFWKAADLGEMLGAEGSARFRALEGESAAAAAREARQGRPIHRLFLILAGILLALESLLSRRVAPSRVPRKPSA